MTVKFLLNFLQKLTFICTSFGAIFLISNNNLSPKPYNALHYICYHFKNKFDLFTLNKVEPPESTMFLNKTFLKSKSDFCIEYIKTS